MKRLALLLLLVFGVGLAACTMPSLNPFDWGSDDHGHDDGEPASAPDPDTVTGQVSIWMNLLIRFGWFGIVLMFVVPGVRVPFIALWVAIFSMLTVPFDYAHLRYTQWAAAKYPERWVPAPKEPKP